MGDVLRPRRPYPPPSSRLRSSRGDPHHPVPGGSAPRPPYRPERPRPQTPDGLILSPSGV
ncbi:hypothetical protein FE633_36945 [Streptomyces montanus]|uniref:Uncharacterized protein n=1 Tax=Streptomyces montanus TaxID=2580423 RepID=A0A5R9FFL2_9ACTN|nr:hypothetical protein FE633_36945 [Streptomyces montanus]